MRSTTFDNDSLLKVSISKNADLKLHLAESLPLIDGDYAQITQVTMNLITNASDALADKSGSILVSTGVMDCDQEYFKTTVFPKELEDGTYVFLEVSDTGKGMDQETVKKIFDPFFTTKFIGHGLGLAAVLGIVRGHDGAIRVYSEPDKGTAIKVIFPVSKTQHSNYIQTKEEETIQVTGGTVLLVDDEESVLHVSQSLIEHVGFSVITAKNGKEALRIYQENKEKISVVILDLTMPGMSGEEVFRELRTLNPNIKILMSSGYNEQEVVQRFAGKGLTGFIQKPYTINTLRKKFSDIYNTNVI